MALHLALGDPGQDVVERVDRAHAVEDAGHLAVIERDAHGLPPPSGTGAALIAPAEFTWIRNTFGVVPAGAS